MNELITQIREQRGLNQKDFAELLGISEAMLSRLESGERQPGRKTLKALLAVTTQEQALRILDALKDNGKEAANAT